MLLLDDDDELSEVPDEARRDSLRSLGPID
jgi:hypothetical protein